MEGNDRVILHEALTKQDSRLFAGIRHADLHCHGITSAPFDVLRRLNPSIKLPPRRFASFQAFNEYLRDNVAPAVANIDALRLIVRETLQRFIEEGVCYTELSFDLTVPEYLNVPMQEYFGAICEEVDKVRGRLKVCLEAGLDREIDPDKSLSLLSQALNSANLGSVDLYGNELASPIGNFVQIYRFAKDRGLKRKAHVGELGTAADVQDAVEMLDLQAVQHGIESAQDPRVMDFLRRRGTVLNVCPQSNLALRIEDDIRTHPIRQLLQQGLIVTVNSDDLSLFGKSVGDQLVDLYANGVCSEEDAGRIIDNGLMQN